MKKRASGIFLHISSLPSLYVIGDLGPNAYTFADFLAEAGQSYWQVLPLNPTRLDNYNCPYSSHSAFAGNTLLISPELMVGDGLLESAYLEPIPEFPKERVNYEKVTTYKEILFHRAYEQFKKSNKKTEFEDFCARHSFWLNDYADFVSFKNHFQGRLWSEWPKEIRDREPSALQGLEKQLEPVIEKEKFLQYLFYHQWFKLKNYCNQKGIQIIGDTPIYVDYDSAEVWTHPEIFSLDKEKKPVLVSGVPPDYFSPTGQYWGNPVYRWEVLKQEGYDWWVKRIGHNQKLFDLLRIDHFRGFVDFWAIPAEEKTAIKGRWEKGPKHQLFNEVLKHFPGIQIIAEDLGIITDEVREFIRELGFPGMKVLLFAWTKDLPQNPYAPHNHIHNCVLYTGTHDNNTARGWFESEASKEERERFCNYLGREVSKEEVHWVLVRIAMSSVADTAIIPMQDLLGLNQSARMNHPAVPKGNWEWRLVPELLTKELVIKLKEMTELYNRASQKL